MISYNGVIYNDIPVKQVVWSILFDLYYKCIKSVYLYLKKNP